MQITNRRFNSIIYILKIVYDFFILINKEKIFISSHQIIKLLCIIVLRVKKGNSKFGCCENEKTEERRKEKCKFVHFCLYTTDDVM